MSSRPSSGGSTSRPTIAARLARAGCVAANEEAGELLAAAGGDDEVLLELVARREAGEPLAWVTGTTTFAGHRLQVRRGVYVPRWQTEQLALRAAALLPEDGTAADLCTGSGAVAVVLARQRPSARVVASDLDPVACRCARDNGVEAYAGHLADPLPEEVGGRCDVVTAVAPYVPSAQLQYLPRDARDHEPSSTLDGGPDGTTVLVGVVSAAAQLLHPGGVLLVELGGDEDALLAGHLTEAGFAVRRRMEDDEGDLRGLEAVRRPADAGGAPDLPPSRRRRAAGRRSGARTPPRA